MIKKDPSKMTQILTLVHQGNNGIVNINREVQKRNELIWGKKMIVEHGEFQVGS